MSGSMDNSAKRIWDDRYASTGSATPLSGQPGGDPIHYTLHKFLYAHSISIPTTGRLDGWITADVAESYLKPPVQRMLALGTGMANIEEFLLKQGYVEHILGYEMSESACRAIMERVRGTPLEGRIEMRSVDVLHDDLPDGAFDVVQVQAAIHHFERIEEMFALMHRVLKPGWLLMYDEYVGPDHHQFPPEIKEILNAVNDCLDARYRLDTLAGAVRDTVNTPGLDVILAMDASEGVHASRILPLTYQWFEVLQRRDFGGTLMRPFFTGILRNFDWENPKDQTVARLIIMIERLLLKYNVIPTHSTDIVARRRPFPLAPLTDAECARIGYADWRPPPRCATPDAA